MSDDVRVTVRLWDDQHAQLEVLVDAGEYPSRSEAIRTAVDRLLDQYDDPRRPSRSACQDAGVADAD